MATSFTTDVTQWQGVDEKPTNGSHNLVESGGVSGAISKVQLPTLGMTENVFYQQNTRSGYYINNSNTIEQYTGSDVFVLTRYLPLPDKWTSIVYSGINGYSTVRARFSVTTDDSEAGARYTLTGDGLEHEIPYNSNYSEKKYIVLTVFRGVSGSTPLLNNVVIKFKDGDSIVGQLESITQNITDIEGEIQDVSSDLESLDEELNGHKTTPTFDYGYVKAADGTIVEQTSSSTYRYSDFIAVTPGSSIDVKNVCGSRSVFVVAMYQTDSGNADTTLSVKGTNSNAVYDIDNLVIPAGINYIRIVYITTYLPVGATCHIEIGGSLSGIQKEVTNIITEQAAINARLENIFIENDTMLKTPNVSPRKAAIAFQIDWASNAYPTMLDYAELLASYGIKKSTYFIRPNRASESYGLDVMLEIQRLGNEIGLHTDEQHLITPSDETVSVEDMKTYIADWLDQMYNKGFKNLPGIVCRTAKIQEALIPTVREYFTHMVGVSSGPMDYNAKDMTQDVPPVPVILAAVNTLQKESWRPFRIDIELTPAEVADSLETTVINNVKAAIDKAIQDKGYLVIYGHSYNLPSSTYTITNNVLTGILSYVQTKMISGDLIVGSTSDILNYYYTKRNYEQ